MGCSLIGPALWRRRQGKGREVGGVEREGYRHRGDEEGKRYDRTPVCSAARVRARPYARVYPRIET